MPYNRILTDIDRELYKRDINEMYEVLPELSHKKIGAAMVQEAFVYRTARELFIDRASVLSAGAYHDVAGELLRLYGYAVFDVDPVINTDLHTFMNRWEYKFEGIISTSVLEHTVDEEEFLRDCCKSLEPSGYCIMTMDYKEGWNKGERVPYTSNRFFTKHDLTVRFPKIIKEYDCALVDKPNYDDVDTFSWEDIPYSFATFVFRKGNNA